MSVQDNLTALFAAWSAENANGREAQVAPAIGDSFFYADPNTPAPVTSAAGYVDYIAMFTANVPSSLCLPTFTCNAFEGGAWSLFRVTCDGAVDPPPLPPPPPPPPVEPSRVLDDFLSVVTEHVEPCATVIRERAMLVISDIVTVVNSAATPSSSAGGDESARGVQ